MPHYLPPMAERRAWVEGQLKKRVDPRLDDIQLMGHRIAVVLAPADEMTEGGIHIPQTSQNRLGAGFIVAMGELAGSGDHTYSPWLTYTEAVPDWSRNVDPMEHWGYRYVVFGAYQTNTLRMNAKDREFESDYYIMHAKDVWCFGNDEDWEAPSPSSDN